MKYIIKGKLCGELCGICREPLAKIKVAIYKPYRKDDLLAVALANTKETIHIVNDKELKDRSKLLVATVEADENGFYQFEMDESDGPYDIDIIIDSVSGSDDSLKKPLQIHLTTIYPKWRRNKQGQNSYTWNYCIPHRLWCSVRGYYFDAWVICGALENCDTGSPIPNALVTAWDDDFVSDDNLGTATTDANGRFRIDYSSADFKKTFLSPLINVETDPGFPLSFQSGPDIYFKAELGGTIILEEGSSERRDNVGYCLCVNLCTNKVIPGDGVDDVIFPSAWTGIGSAFTIPTGSILNDFDADGFAGAKKYGLTGRIRMTGQAAHKRSNGNRIEYRFLVSDVTSLNGGAAPALGNFNKIVGVEPGLFEVSKVAQIQRNSFPYPVLDVFSDLSDFDSNGWFDVNSAIERTLSNNSIPLSQINDWNFIDVDTLITINTAALTSAANVPNNAANAGEVVPVSDRISLERIAIRFEIREVIDKTANIFSILSGSGRTLNNVVINNNPVFMKMVLNELETSGSCTPISGIIHAAYTVHHPLLEDVSIRVRSNSNSVNKLLSDGFISLTNNTNAGVNHGSNSSLQINGTPNDLQRCTYEMTLSVRRRLHTGDSQVSRNDIDVLFFYDI